VNYEKYLIAAGVDDPELRQQACASAFAAAHHWYLSNFPLFAANK
jgi:hypothetical protein